MPKLFNKTWRRGHKHKNSFSFTSLTFPVPARRKTVWRWQTNETLTRSANVIYWLNTKRVEIHAEKVFGRRECDGDLMLDYWISAIECLQLALLSPQQTFRINWPRRVQLVVSVCVINGSAERHCEEVLTESADDLSSHISVLARRSNGDEESQPKCC